MRTIAFEPELLDVGKVICKSQLSQLNLDWTNCEITTMQRITRNVDPRNFAFLGYRNLWMETFG